MEILLLFNTNIRLHGINIIILEILNKHTKFFIQTHIAVKIAINT